MAKFKAAVNLSPLEDYRQAAAANPQSVEAHANLGWGFYGAEQFDRAVTEFNEALRLEPGHLEALYGLGLARKCSGAKAEAVSAFTAAIEQLPKLEDRMRSDVLRRLVRGQISVIQTGEWKLASILGADA